MSKHGDFLLYIQKTHLSILEEKKSKKLLSFQQATEEEIKQILSNNPELTTQIENVVDFVYECFIKRSLREVKKNGFNKYE